MNNHDIQETIRVLKIIKESHQEATHAEDRERSFGLCEAAGIMFMGDETFALIIRLLEKEIKDNEAMAVLNNKIKAAQFIYELRKENPVALPTQPTLLDEINRLAEEHRKAKETQEIRSVIDEAQKRGWEGGW